MKCEALIDIIIPGTVETIGSNAFSYCNNLKSVIILEGTKIINESVFSYCQNLKEVVFGDNKFGRVPYIGTENIIITALNGRILRQ